MTTEEDWLQYREVIRAHIEKHGRSIQQVGDSEGDDQQEPPFMYTVGNHAAGMPELLIVGTNKSGFATVLNRLSDIQKERGRALEHEELVGVGGKFPLRVVDAGDLGRHYAAFARIYYATETLEVRQVLLPDPQGRWPDTPGCAAPYREQPILSAAAKTPN